MFLRFFGMPLDLVLRDIMEVVGGQREGLTSNYSYIADLGTAKVYYARCSSRQRPGFEPEHLVYAMVLKRTRHFSAAK